MEVASRHPLVAGHLLLLQMLPFCLASSAAGLSQLRCFLMQIEGGKRINVELMPDVLHPNAAGMEQMLTKCLDPALGHKQVDLAE